MPKEMLLQKLLSNQSRQPLPDKEKTHRFIEQLFAFLFNSNGFNKERLELQYDELRNDLSSHVALVLVAAGNEVGFGSGHVLLGSALCTLFSGWARGIAVRVGDRGGGPARLLL